MGFTTTAPSPIIQSRTVLLLLDWTSCHWGWPTQTELLASTVNSPVPAGQSFVSGGRTPPFHFQSALASLRGGVHDRPRLPGCMYNARYPYRYVDAAPAQSPLAPHEKQPPSFPPANLNSDQAVSVQFPALTPKYVLCAALMPVSL